MRTFLLSAILMIACISLSAQGLRFTMVNPQTNEITIKNFGGAAVNIASYRFCSLFQYDNLNSAAVVIQQGDFMLDPSEEVTVIWNEAVGMNAAGADLAIYLPMGSFADASAMVDFVQWGSAGNGRENVANAAGIWVAGTFIVGDVPFTYIGDGSQDGVQFWTSGSIGTTTIVINEVDSDNAGTDMMEFIELYGEPGESLDGMVIVFLNGSTDVSYAAYDLDGMSLDGNGFFVLGNAGVAQAGMTFPDNSLQNGPDAVALYYGDATDWPTGTPLTTSNLIDALVYDTSDADDLELLTLLNAGQAQVDEGANSNAVNESASRVPDGGVQRNTDTYVAQVPTPGASNLIVCLGGSVSAMGMGTTATACVNYVSSEIEFSNTSSTGDAEYIYLITDESNIIITVLDGTNSYDFAGQPTGVCRVWGLSYTGMLDAGTLEAGDDATMISGGDCMSLSTNFVTVNKEECAPNTCNGGMVDSDQGTGPVIVCIDDESNIFTFTNTSATPEAEYLYVVTDTDNNILFVLDTDSYDFNNGPEETCRVWGLSFTGALVPGTFDAGMPATGVLTDGDCLSLSENFVTIVKQDCVITNGCSDLFFSEYIEGSSFNKALEIYNPTQQVIDLSEYEVLLYPNGNTEAQNALTLEGLLNPGDVYIISNPQATPLILNIADITGSVTFYNGDDAIELLHNGIVIDVIGVAGEDPGDNWTVGSGSTGEHTLVRKIEVTEGTTSWAEGALQWDVFPQDNFASIGSHTTFPCVTEPQISFSAGNLNVNEDGVEISFSVNATNLESVVNATISLVSETATAGDDYVLALPIDFTIDPMDMEPQTFTMTINEDDVEEGDENVVLMLSNTEGVTVTVSQLTINIIDNDAPIPVLDIAEVTPVNADGLAEEIGLECELRGIVHGVNLRPAGLQFTLIDDTDGIGVFSASENFGYTVQEGDSIHVIGTIEQFNGLTQINLNALTYISSDNEINEPAIVDALNENTESQVVQLKCVSLVDPAEWTNSGSGFNVTVTNGTLQFTVRIDADVELFGTPAPEGVFTVSGIGGQFDSSSPFDSGYQLLPRYAADLEQGPIPGFELTEGGVDGCIDAGSGTTYDFTVESNESNGVLYTWTLEWDGQAPIEQTGNPTNFSGGFTETPDEMTVSLVVTLNGCAASSEAVYCVLYQGVEEYDRNFSLYPNPGNGNVQLQSDLNIQSVDVLNSAGQLVKSEGGLNQRFVNLNLSELSPGMYLVRIADEKGEFYSRIIIE